MAGTARKPRAKRSRTAELAHELRKHLATILLWEQILRHTEDPAVRAQALDAIRESAREQDRAIERVLGRPRARAR